MLAMSKIPSRVAAPAVSRALSQGLSTRQNARPSPTTSSSSVTSPSASSVSISYAYFRTFCKYSTWKSSMIFASFAVDGVLSAVMIAVLIAASPVVASAVPKSLAAARFVARSKVVKPAALPM